MVHQSKEICEYSINAEGDYDNIVQDSLKYQNAHSVLGIVESYRWFTI